MVLILLQSIIKETNVLIRVSITWLLCSHILTTDSVSFWSVLLQGKYIGVKNIRD